MSSAHPDPIVLSDDHCSRWREQWDRIRQGEIIPADQLIARPTPYPGVTVRSASIRHADGDELYRGTPAGGVVIDSSVIDDIVTGEPVIVWHTVSVHRGRIYYQAVRDDDILDVGDDGCLEYTGLYNPGHVGRLLRDIERIRVSGGLALDRKSHAMSRLVAIIATGGRTDVTDKDMSGKAKCLDCGATAVHERGPGSPLVIRHAEGCPNQEGDGQGWTTEAANENVRQCGATGVTRGGWQGRCFLPTGHEGPCMDLGV